MVTAGTTCNRITSLWNCLASASTYRAAPWQRGENSTGNRIFDNVPMGHLFQFRVFQWISTAKTPKYRKTTINSVRKSDPVARKELRIPARDGSGSRRDGWRITPNMA